MARTRGDVFDKRSEQGLTFEAFIPFDGMPLLQGSRGE